MHQKVKEVRFSHTFFHATAQSNIPSILKSGLLISHRGTNPLGLDYDIDYNKIYSAEEVEQHNKPASIHLTEDYGNAKEFQQIIQQSHGQPAVILKVTIDSTKDTLKPDSEDDKAYICLNNIDSERISVVNDSDTREDPTEDEEVLENCGPALRI